MIMKRKSTSYSYAVKRRLMKKRVKEALFRAALKKKKRQQDQDLLDDTCFPEVQQREEGGFLECEFGFLSNGEFVQLTKGFLVNSGAGLLTYYIPVVDNQGFLLGEFRKLDCDLNFVQDEEKNLVS